MAKLKSFLGKIPIFLFTIPLFLVLHIEATFHRLIKYEFVYGEIFQLFIAPWVIFILCLLLLKGKDKSNAYALMLCFIFFFFADIKDYFYKISPDFFAGRYVFLIPSIVVICIGGFIFIKRSNSTFRNIVRYANLVFICFLVFDTVKILFLDNTDAKSFFQGNDSISADYRPCDNCEKPDIYYLVFDYYTSSKCLAEEFQYDNSALDTFLLNKRFFVVKKSRSNYNFTAHSMSSTFNMNYLEKITPFKKIYLRDYLPVIGSVFDNELISILQKEGYYINNLSIFDFKNAPSAIPHFNMWRYDMLYSRHNIFKKIDLEIGWFFRSKLSHIITLSSSQRTKYVSEKDRHDRLALADLEKTISFDSKPKFTYIHMETAHTPFLLDSTGKLKEPRTGPVSAEQDKADYVDQLIYTNKLIKQSVNSIFEKSKRPFIIILQGDHGFRFFDYNKREKEYPNLNAFFYPDNDYSGLNDSLTNVNTFRIVLNKLFKQKLQLVKDSTVHIDY